MWHYGILYKESPEMDFRAMRYSIIVLPGAGDRRIMNPDQPEPFGGVGKEVL